MPRLTLEGNLTVTAYEYEDTIIAIDGDRLEETLEGELPHTSSGRYGVGTDTYGRVRVTIETLEDPQDA